MAQEVKPVVIKTVGFGNQDPKARFFSGRADIQPHFHKPGDYYCGRCMTHIRVPA